MWQLAKANLFSSLILMALIYTGLVVLSLPDIPTLDLITLTFVLPGVMALSLVVPIYFKLQSRKGKNVVAFSAAVVGFLIGAAIGILESLYFLPIPVPYPPGVVPMTPVGLARIDVELLLFWAICGCVMASLYRLFMRTKPSPSGRG
jgi:membrane protease YdiL (CAAX protease family)